MFSRTSVRRMVICLAMGAVLLASCVAAPDEVKLAPLQQGETFEITLEANATTGFSWEIAQIDKDIVQLVGSEYVPDPNAEGLDGKGGKAVFRFQAVGSGETTLKWVYHRPWEKDVEPLRTHVVQVSVF